MDLSPLSPSRRAVQTTAEDALRVNRRNLVVIGIMPPQFRGALEGMRSDLWVPFTMGAELGAKENETFSERTSPTRTSPISASKTESWRYALSESVKVPLTLLFEHGRR